MRKVFKANQNEISIEQFEVAWNIKTVLSIN